MKDNIYTIKFKHLVLQIARKNNNGFFLQLTEIFPSEYSDGRTEDPRTNVITQLNNMIG